MSNGQMEGWTGQETKERARPSVSGEMTLKERRGEIFQTFSTISDIPILPKHKELRV